MFVSVTAARLRMNRFLCRCFAELEMPDRQYPVTGQIVLRLQLVAFMAHQRINRLAAIDGRTDERRRVAEGRKEGRKARVHELEKSRKASVCNHYQRRPV